MSAHLVAIALAALVIGAGLGIIVFDQQPKATSRRERKLKERHLRTRTVGFAVVVLGSLLLLVGIVLGPRSN